jgi:hypothetical protein
MSQHEDTGAEKVYVILDEIRRELGLVRTDVAVLAAAQPQILQIVEDHERRLRAVETSVPTGADNANRIARLEGHVEEIGHQFDTLRSELDKNSWLPKLSWSLVIAVVGLIVGGFGSQFFVG